MEPFKNDVTGGGGRGPDKLVTNGDKGEGVLANGDVTIKIFIYLNTYFCILLKHLSQ